MGTLVFGLAGSTSAAVSSGERTVLVPIPSCRLLDTRPGLDNVGPRATPLGVDETYATAVRGANGRCSIPGDAVAVSLNVTVVNPTSSSFLAVRPADVAAAPGSSLNWVAGQAPTPNAVTTKLSGDGRIALYNLSGTVDVVVDVIGYYADHNFDDRYYTKAEVDARTTREVVDSTGVGVPALPSGGYLSYYYVETVTTTTTGHWMVFKTVGGVYQQCTPSVYGALYYIEVDGVPVRSSVQFKQNAGPVGVDLALSGVTDAVVPAGTHAVTIDSTCGPGGRDAGNGRGTNNTAASVVVIG